MAEIASARAQSRKARIVDAGRAQFLETGLRATTMEAIARRAGVAKPTLYNYFPDKQSVFDAVIAGLIDEMKTAVSVALSADMAPSDRITAAIIAKFGAAFRIVQGSPHADELMYDRDLTASPAMVELRAWMVGQVAACLRDAGHAEAESLPPVLLAACEGLFKAPGIGAGDLPRHVAIVVARLIDGSAGRAG